MKILTLLALILAGSLAAQTSAAPAKKSTKKQADAVPSAADASAAPRQSPPDVVIPKGAVEGEDGNFRYTDAKGKKWIYRKTPFGVAKSEDKPAPVTTPQQDTLTVATDAGDSVHFEKPSPFGTVKWDKKKTELDANEQAVWNRQKKQ